MINSLVRISGTVAVVSLLVIVITKSMHTDSDCKALSSPFRSLLLCTDERCGSYPFMCDDSHCACWFPHRSHRSTCQSEQAMGEIVASIRHAGKLLAEFNSIDSVIERGIAVLSNLRYRNETLSLSQKSILSDYSGYVDKLLAEEPQIVNKITGASFARMTREIRQLQERGSNLVVHERDLKQRLSILSSVIDKAKRTVESLWNSDYLK